ncbi:hypothetical protein R7Z51_24680, partial [Vibrio sp. 1579]|nr:hypothetical protein [Vibrio sp. 1579]
YERIVCLKWVNFKSALVGHFYIGADSGNALINIALISVSILSFVTVLLTEFKLTKLRATVVAFNRGERA